MLALFGSYHFTKNAGDDFDTPVPSSLKYFRFFVDTNLNSWFYTKKCLSFVIITINIASILTIVNSKPNKAQELQDNMEANTSFQKVPNLNNINQILIDTLIILQFQFQQESHPMCILNIYQDPLAYHQ